MAHPSAPIDRTLDALRWLGSLVGAGVRRLRVDQRGEGVISAAIAVLIMAFLGASMWVLFDKVFQDTNRKTQNQVELIGS